MHDDAWDEEQWEAFLRDNDRRVDRYLELFQGFLQEHPRPPEDDHDDASREHDHAVREHRQGR